MENVAGGKGTAHDIKRKRWSLLIIIFEPQDEKSQPDSYVFLI
jgi:hypothetical protein